MQDQNLTSDYSSSGRLSPFLLSSANVFLTKINSRDDDLIQSLKEAKAISKGEAKASRRFEIVPTDVKAVREQIGLSQSEFAFLHKLLSIEVLAKPFPRRPC